MNPGLMRSILRSIHLLLSIPVFGYCYSPFVYLPEYAAPTRYVFIPLMFVTGLLMWKGHLLVRLFSRKSQRA
jgi:hypothetical protein